MKRERESKSDKARSEWEFCMALLCPGGRELAQRSSKLSPVDVDFTHGQKSRTCKRDEVDQDRATTMLGFVGLVRRERS